MPYCINMSVPSNTRLGPKRIGYQRSQRMQVKALSPRTHSYQHRHMVLVAQLVEQLVVIQLVAGSNPVWHPKGTIMSIEKSYRIIGHNSPGQLGLAP